MQEVCHTKSGTRRLSERGTGMWKLLVFLTGLFLTAHAGFQYVPVAYNAAALRQEMQTVVDQSIISPMAQADRIGWTKKKLVEAMKPFDLPADTQMEVKRSSNEAAISATVSYTIPVNMLPFGMYTYPYQFKYTATTGSFLTK